MTHLLQKTDTQKHTKTISDTKRTQVANLQNHIQEILSDNFHTFLQGSYRNETAISDINDVDIVAVRKTTYSGIYSNIQTVDKIDWETIFTEIETKLINQNIYKWIIIKKEKCITVETSNFKADIVPAVKICQDVNQDPIAIHTNNG
jgi:tRNA nucleotidyltransferase (CCA-adding enzyme)